MGYWRAGPDGESLVMEETGIVWGDEPADIMADALEAIVRVFKRDVGRKPTEVELKSGLMFSLGGVLEDEE